MPGGKRSAGRCMHRSDRPAALQTLRRRRNRARRIIDTPASRAGGEGTKCCAATRASDPALALASWRALHDYLVVGMKGVVM